MLHEYHTWPPPQDPTFQPGCYVFGFTVAGYGYFGNARTYNQQAIFGARPFGTEIAGTNIESDIFRFRYGSPNPKKPYRKNGTWHTSPNPWPKTPLMCCRAHGAWAKRIIFFTWRNRQMLRRYTPYAGSPKTYLAPWSLKLMESSFLWSCLTDENKARLNADAKRTRQATQGHNYFTKLYIKDDPRWLDYV